MNYSITQFGKPLDKSKYIIDEENKTFSTEEDSLILDFTGLNGWSFKTGLGCTFITGSRCTFKTGSRCIFRTLWGCTFDTLWDCTFDTGSDCIFETGGDCTFNIYGNFKKIKTEGNSIVLIRNRRIHTYLEEEVEIYFQDGIILYTENKFTKNKYLMMKELIK